MEKFEEKFIELCEFVYSKLNSFYSIECHTGLARLLASTLKIYRMRIVSLSSRPDQSESDSQQKKSVKNLSRKLTATFDLVLSFFDSKSSQLKLDIQQIVVEAAFDRYLFRTWLFRFCERREVVLGNLYIGLAVDELRELRMDTVGPTSYLSCVSGYFSIGDPMSKFAGECMFNDDMENLLFDKLYAKQMEKYEMFEESNVSSM